MSDGLVVISRYVLFFLKHENLSIQKQLLKNEI